MQERATYDAGGAGHPELEELAALHDGKLSAEEAQSLRAHFARCEPCLALFAETASFLADDEHAADAAEIPDLEIAAAAAIPLPFRPREVPQPQPRMRRAPRRVALATAVAAAVVAVFGTVIYQQIFGPPQVEVARLLTSLAGRQAAIAQSYWGPVTRGVSTGPDDHTRAAFQLGVEMVNLDVSLAVGDRAPAENAAAHVNGILKEASAGFDTRQFFLELPAKIHSGAPLASLAAEVRKARQDFEGYLEKDDYDFGRWAESGRLAAAAAQPDFLMARDTRRFPRTLRGHLGKLTPRPAAALDAIAKILDRGELTAADYKALDAQFREILDSYYPV
ncbi:MAG TPA: zf-HC2 domain-containing protein [Thermoanaerobaculia bacterium]